MEASFLVKNNQKFKEELSYFENEIENKSIPFNSNTEILIFLYFYTNKLHLHFLEATFSEGEYLVDIINTKIETYQSRLDNHHIVILYYKIACLYFGMNKNKECIFYLSKIINTKDLKVAEDLQCFARSLKLNSTL